MRNCGDRKGRQFFGSIRAKLRKALSRMGFGKYGVVSVIAVCAKSVR